jgi:hypothetical protein
MRSIYIYRILLMLFLFIYQAVGPMVYCDVMQNYTIPSDFKIDAIFNSGFSPLKSWQTSITSKGSVQQICWPSFKNRLGEKTVSNSELSNKDLSELIIRINEARFFKLKSRYSNRETDGQGLTLKIGMAGREHEVEVYIPMAQMNKSGVQRFMIIWDELLRKVPAPNKEQIPGMYRKEPARR